MHVCVNKLYPQSVPERREISGQNLNYLDKSVESLDKPWFDKFLTELEKKLDTTLAGRQLFWFLAHLASENKKSYLPIRQIYLPWTTWWHFFWALRYLLGHYNSSLAPFIYNVTEILQLTLQLMSLMWYFNSFLLFLSFLIPCLSCLWSDHAYHQSSVCHQLHAFRE